MEAREQISDVLSKVECVHTDYSLRIRWNGEQARAFALARIHSDYRGSDDYGCDVCQLEVINSLRRYLGRPELKDAAPESLYLERITICKGDDDRGIARCPSLSDGFHFKASFPFVEFKNANCQQCGCFIHLKAGQNFFTCPLNKWP